MNMFTRQGWRRTLLLAAAAVVIGAWAGWAQTWDCGEEPGTVTATLSNGTLTISGKGSTECAECFPSASYYPWYDSRNSITKVVVEDGVTFGQAAFQECSRITSATVGSVTAKRKGSTITFSGKGVATYMHSLILGFGKGYTISTVIIEEGVTSIGNAAFAHMYDLTFIKIPNSVTDIEKRAFYWCGITEVTIPNSVTKIGDEAFSGSRLKSVTIPNSVTKIGNEAFSGSRLMKSVTIGENVTSIGSGAFYGCDSLESIIIPNSVTSIGNNAFATVIASGTSGLQGLKSVIIGDGVTSIDGFKFHSNTQLTTVVIGNGVTSMGIYLFGGCTGLKSVTIGSKVTSIGDDAFKNCTNLKSLVSLNPVPPTGLGVNDIKGATLYVPASSIGAYLAALDWKEFTNTNVAKIATITFNSQSGIDVSPQTLILINNNKAVKPADPARPGQIVAGWYKDPEYSAAWNFDTDTVTADMTLYAKWIPGSVITWNTYGGTPTPTQTTVANGGSIAAPVAITRSDRVFGGWYSDAGLTKPVSFPLTNVTEPQSFYAKWMNIGVANVAGVPRAIKVGAQFTLDGTVVPDDATNSTIVWSIEDAGTTDAGIYNDDVILALSKGPIILKATVVGGNADDTDYEQLFDITVGDAIIAVLSNDRVIPQSNPSEKVVVSPVTALSAEFTVGPNPASRSSGAVNFFRHGSRVAYSTLSIYDAFGNVVKKMRVIDDAVGSQTTRRVSSWDLRDAKGRSVPEGTYLVKGVLKTSGGKRERVSLVVGVR